MVSTTIMLNVETSIINDTNFSEQKNLSKFKNAVYVMKNLIKLGTSF